MLQKICLLDQCIDLLGEDLKETKKVAENINCKIIINPYYHKQCSTKIKDKVLKYWKKGGKKEK